MSDLEDLFDYDAGLDDILKSLPPVPKHDAPKQNTSEPEDATAVLGLDADLKMTKKRAPIAKLDETRLLSQNGIPKLRKTAKTKLRFKGKGHEFSDLGRLLTFYQLWLDNLYPRAKFADGLAMIEKLGHSKRIQIMRKEWIDEEKPKYQYNDDNSNNDILAPPISTSMPSGPENRVQSDGHHMPARGAENNLTNNNNAPADDDDLDMLLAEADFGGQDKNNSPAFKDTTNRSGVDMSAQEDNVPSDDDLDMLLAEAQNNPNLTPNNSNLNGTTHMETSREEDDLDLLLAEAENLGHS